VGDISSPPLLFNVLPLDHGAFGASALAPSAHRLPNPNLNVVPAHLAGSEMKQQKITAIQCDIALVI